MRKSVNPKRRIAPVNSLNSEEQSSLLNGLRYVGSALHKQFPADYGFHPPVSPRPHKSLCDDKRIITLPEAYRLFVAGIKKGLVSTYRQNGVPKYVWCVDEQGEVYEAKIGSDGFHGYRLDEENERTMRRIILKEWKARNDG